MLFGLHFRLLFVTVDFGFFFFKQKTAYEMRISDWSSDVCSSDLDAAAEQRAVLVAVGEGLAVLRTEEARQDRKALRVERFGDFWLRHDCRPAASRASNACLRSTPQRSEARRVGTECVSKGRVRRAP